jgi:hypothetical protein
MPRRDLIILVVLFIALATLVGLAPRSDDQQTDNASSFASREGGALALFRWLDGLDYQVERLAYREFAPDPEADMLVVLAPSERYSREHAEAVRAWVEAGGTLLVAEPRPNPFAGAAPLLAAFDLEVVLPPEGQTQAPVLQPALGDPPARRLAASTIAVIASERADLAPLAGSHAAPVLVGLQHGAGYVYASAVVQPFTNQGLRDPDNAAVVLNLLRRVPPGGYVLFDEFHHGFMGQAEANLRALLLGTAWGWATLYAVLVGAAYLALTGRRFGRPVPLRAEADRRSSAEYLVSMAGLLRRGGKGAYALGHYRTLLRRRLARAHGLSPDLDDAALVAAIAETRPALAAAAADLLARMAAPPPDETAMLRLIAEADALEA